MGNDTGGGLCQIVATTRPERIGRLVLTSCDAYEETLALRIVMAALKPAQIPALVPILFAPLRLRPLRTPFIRPLALARLEPEVSDSYALPALIDGRVRRDASRLIAGLDFKPLRDAATRFGEFERPVLVAWSGDDRIFPRRHAEQLASDFPDARLELIEGARTFSAEDQPGRVAELVAGFVREPVHPARA